MRLRASGLDKVRGRREAEPREGEEGGAPVEKVRVKGLRIKAFSHLEMRKKIKTEKLEPLLNVSALLCQSLSA